jgi:hypothetical protein
MCIFLWPWKYRLICVAKNSTDVSSRIIVNNIYFTE